MASANEQIGIAKAAYYPVVGLGALGGFNAAPCWVVTWPNRVVAVGPTLSETLYDGGRRGANSLDRGRELRCGRRQITARLVTAFQQGGG